MILSLFATARMTICSTIVNKNLSSQGSIISPEQSYTNIIYEQNSVYYVKKVKDNEIIASSKDFAVVWKYTLLDGQSTFIRNGVYYLHSMITSDIIANVTIKGESVEGCIIDLSYVHNYTKSGSTGYIPSGQYAGILIRGTRINIESLTFQNYSSVVLGLGEYDSNTPSNNNTIRNIRFKNCSSGGIYLYDGSNSVIDSIEGDNPYGMVYFWYGNQSNIKVSNVYMEPSIDTAIFGVDSVVAFLPYKGANVSNISVSNIIGNYSKYYFQGGRNLHIGGVVDFHSSAGGYLPPNSAGNQSWNNLKVNNIYGYHAPALDIAWNLTGLTNSLFENIHSSYAQGLGGVENGVFILLQLSNANITVSNVVFKNIYVDHAHGAGFNFLVSSKGTPSSSVFANVNNITLENLYLVNNNQQRSTINSSPNDIYWGVGGLNIGNHGEGIKVFSGLQIKNLVAIDNSSSPTQQYPAIIWNCGASGTKFNNVQIIDGMFRGNVNNFIGQVNNQGIVDITWINTSTG